MDTMYLQFKSFMDERPYVESIKIEYSNASYFVLSIRCRDKDSGQMKLMSRDIQYEDLPRLSEDEYRDLIYILSRMYDECLCVE